MTDKALILGGTGRFGRNCAEAFWNAGWQVQIFDRSQDDLMDAAKDADVIVNGWKPVYSEWDAQLPQITARVIEAARRNNCTVILPGNVYVFGEDAPETFGPHVPHRATNPLGKLRVRMEAQYKASGIQVINLRCGDFIDTEGSGNWFDKIMAPTLAKGVLTYPGNPQMPHAWAFLPDVARAAVMLASKRADLPCYTDMPFPGYTLSGEDMAALSSEVLARSVTVKQMNWLPLQLARPFWALGSKLIEMRYLWNKPHHLTPEPIQALLPEFEPTDPVIALARAITPVLQTDGASRRAA